MPKTAGVLRQEIYFTDNYSKHNPNPYIQSKPNNHRNKKIHNHIFHIFGTNSQLYLALDLTKPLDSLKRRAKFMMLRNIVVLLYIIF